MASCPWSGLTSRSRRLIQRARSQRFESMFSELTGEGKSKKLKKIEKKEKKKKKKVRVRETMRQ